MCISLILPPHSSTFTCLPFSFASTPLTPNPSLHTPHSTPLTPHPSLHTPHSTPSLHTPHSHSTSLLHPSLYTPPPPLTLHPSFHTPHSTPLTLYHSLCTPHSTPHRTPHSTPLTPPKMYCFKLDKSTSWGNTSLISCHTHNVSRHIIVTWGALTIYVSEMSLKLILSSAVQ